MKLRLDFENASAILETTMTDNFNYQDVPQTNIPELEKNMGLHARYLLNAAQKSDIEELEITLNLRSSRETAEVTQAVWELKNEHDQVVRSLAITSMKDYFCVGIDRRATPEVLAYRVSNHSFTHGAAGQYRQQYLNAINPEIKFESLSDVFYETIAALGLKNRLLQIVEARNESRSASFSNAA